MKVLSVDWDYFYPNDDNYDWGASEKSSFFFDAIWALRVADVNLLTGKPILQEYRPRGTKNFWSQVRNKPLLFIADSHKDLYSLLIEPSVVVNYDAHHDFGYEDHGDVGCDNWARIAKERGLITEYHLIYPVWRKLETETDTLNPGITSVRYSPPTPSKYDFIFVCRSGAWTPPWHDKLFDAFAGSAPHSDVISMVSPRDFNLKKAIADEKIMARRCGLDRD